MEGFMMNVDGNCCEKLTATLSHGGEGPVGECVCTQVGRRMPGGGQKEAETRRMARTMAWPLLLGCSMGGNAARTGI